jgi:hypothetical protein
LQLFERKRRNLGIICANRGVKQYMSPRHYTLLDKTEGVFDSDWDQYLYLKSTEGLQWNTFEKLLHRLDDSDSKSGYVVWKPIVDRHHGTLPIIQFPMNGPDNPIHVPHNPMNGPDNEDIQSIDNVRDRYNYNDQSTSNRVLVPISYKAIHNELDPSGSKYAKAFAGNVEVLFYPALNGRLKWIRKDYWVSDPQMNGFEQQN